MSTFENDDLDYINSQFSAVAVSLDYNTQEQQDPWKHTLTPDSILRDVELPSVYNEYYNLLSSQHPHSLVTVSALENLMESTGVNSIVSEKILSLLSQNTPCLQMALSKTQFNLALAFLACAQNGLGLSLEVLYEHRFDLPVPRLSSMEPSATIATITDIQDTTSSHLEPTDSISSSISTSLQHHQQDIITSDQENIDDDNCSSDRTARSQRMSTVDINKTKKDSVKDYQWFLDMDLITVSLVPQKEGRLFKHVIYLVESQHGTATVKRRFNEFYLLWECLLKRYPLRSVPNLPPKKIKANDAFLEKRRRGLARFMNSLERHPVLMNDNLVKAFLSVQDLQSWWHENQPSMDDELLRTIPKMTSLRDNIPHDLTDRLKRLQRRMTPAIEQYEQMIGIIQRLSSCEQVNANELIRYSVTLNAMDEIEQQTEHQKICHPCQNVVKGQAKVAKSMIAMAGLLDDRALSMNNIFLEHLKYHRNLFIAFKDMLNRKDQLLDTIIDQQHMLPKTIAAKMIIANQNSSSPSSSSSSSSSPTSTYSPYHRPLTNEQIDIILQSNHVRESLHQHRMLFIYSCLASELTYLHQQQAFVSLMYQDLVRQQHKSAQNQHDQWKSLQQDLDTLMPDDPDIFS